MASQDNRMQGHAGYPAAAQNEKHRGREYYAGGSWQSRLGHREVDKLGPDYYSMEYGNFGTQGHIDSDCERWRNEQIHRLDRDYDEYPKERHRKFTDDFGRWREVRSQR